MSKLKELIHILRQHSTVTFTLHGLGESIFECSYFDKAVAELDQLEADAELGRAVRKAYSKGAFLIYDIVEDGCQNIINYNSDSDLEELLEWAKEV